MLNNNREPIAIVGIGCRFPGGAGSPGAFWDLLKEGRDGIVEIPGDRWNVDQFYDANPATPGKMYVRAGGFIDQKIKEFDAAFFGIAPREAGFIDPQQRLLMEVAWEALEDAGIQPESLAGSDTGVYIGGFMLDNLLTQFSPLNREDIGPHSAVGSTLTILSNRLSYVFDLRGPSFTLDTACSSSLVAMHEGCQAIWSGECKLALFGGVNVMYRPENLIAMCKGGFLSPDGRSKSFDIRANGYGRGEGAGIVVLKPYADALRDGDQIYGLVRGTGVNQDGRTDGITVPNPDAQEALIRSVLAQAQVDPNQIRYVEAHGTGTPVGDPLEARAIGAALGRQRAPDTPCVIGSVKANIGHLEAASGVAGLIKLALCLKHDAIPPLANLTVPNPTIPFAELGLRLPLTLEPMPAGPGTPCVAINSFGYGGTNAHAILEQYRAPSADAAPAAAEMGSHAEPAHYLLPLSARSKPALAALAQRYDELLADDTRSVADVCWSAAMRRGHQDQRVAVSGQSRAELRERLQQFAAGEPAAGAVPGSAAHKGQRPVFVLTGMGPQWWGMGRELIATEPVFRAKAEECDAIFRRLAGWSILDAMLADEAVSRIAETDIAQPANFVLQVSLAALWRSWGVEPAAVVGHSVGEVSSAHLAGVLSLEDAILVSYHRSRIQKKAAGIGTMLAVGLSAAAVQPYLDAYPGKLSLAAANAPTSVTLAGDEAALNAIAETLREERVFHRLLNVEVAYHSPTMEPLKPEVMDVLAGLTIHAAEVPLYSTVTGDLAAAGAFDAAYWCDNIREPVMFEKAIGALVRDGHRLFLEIGPHPVLATAITECLGALGVRGTLLASLRRAKPEHPTIFDALGGLYASGAAFDWTRFHAAGGRYVKLPSYPWQREEHWHEGARAYLDRMAVAEHALLGRRLDTPAPVWESTLNANLLPYLQHHRVEDLVILPGAAYVELGLALHRDVNDSDSGHQLLENLEFFKALIVSPNSQPQLHLSYDQASRRYAVFSREREGQPWSQHARGQLSRIPLARPPGRRFEAIRERCPDHVSHADHYTDMRARGLQYGPYFQGVRDLWLSADGAEALARIEGHPALEHTVHRNLMHPTLLDACFQTLISGLVKCDDANVYVPVSIRQIRVFQALPAQFWCHAERHTLHDHMLGGDVTLCDDEGRVLAEVLGVHAQALTQKSQDAMADFDQWLYQFEWERADQPQPDAAVQAQVQAPGRWLLLADAGGTADALAAQLQARGAEVILAHASDAFECIDDTRYCLRPDSKDDMVSLLALAGATPLRGIVHLWSLDAGIDSHAVTDVGTENVVSALYLVQAASAGAGAVKPQVSIVTAGAQCVRRNDRVAVAQAPVIGFGRVAINEHPELRLRLIDVAQPAAADEVADEVANTLADELLSTSVEEETALRAEGRFVSRLARRSAAELAQVGAGVLDADGTDGRAGAWLAKRARRAPGALELEVALEQIALAEGEGKDKDKGKEGGLRGAQAIGVVTAIGAAVTDVRLGERVVLRLKDAPAAFVYVPAAEVLRGAAAGAHALQLPYFCAAYHALHNVAHLGAHETVLIRHAASRLGQAAIQVARWLGATVFAGAASTVERAALRAQGIDYVFDAGSMEGIDAIRALAGERGLDVVFSGGGEGSADGAGEAAALAHGLLGRNGRYIDIGADHGPALALRGNQLRARVDLAQIVAHDAALFEQLAEQVQAYLATGELQPLPVHGIAADGFDPGAHDERPGLRVIALGDLGDAGVRAAADSQQAARFDPEATYLITGGFGGFGLQMAAWMVEQGVRHLVLVGRSGAATLEAKAAVAQLEARGAKVLAAAADIGSDDGIQTLLQAIRTGMPPLKGVFHAAAVLDDAAIKVLEPAKIRTVMQPKAVGAWLLHKHTLDLSLDYFVLFSSVGSLVGNPGQGPYVSANAFLDALAQHRHALGLAATAINWGALGQVGMAARSKGVEDYLNRMGFGSFTPAQAIGALDRILDWKGPANVGAAMMDWSMLGVSYLAWTRAPRNSLLFAALADSGAGHGEQGPLQALRELDAEARAPAVEEALLELVSSILRVNRARIDVDNSLLSMGMDSLMGIELQGAIERRIGIKVSTLELMKGNPISELVAQLVRMVDAHVTPSAPAAADHVEGGAHPSEDQLFKVVKDLDAQLSALSDAEIDQALQAFMAKEEQV